MFLDPRIRKPVKTIPRYEEKNGMSRARFGEILNFEHKRGFFFECLFLKDGTTDAENQWYKKLCFSKNDERNSPASINSYF